MPLREVAKDIVWATLFHLYGAMTAVWQRRRRTT